MYRRVFYSLLLLGALLVGIGLLPQRALAASQSNNMSNKSNSGFVYCYSLSCGGLPPTYQTAAQTTLFLLMNEDSQEEDAREEDPRERIRLMEVAPREDHRQSNRDNSDHLALERDAHCIPTNIEPFLSLFSIKEIESHGNGSPADTLIIAGRRWQCIVVNTERLNLALGRVKSGEVYA